MIDAGYIQNSAHLKPHKNIGTDANPSFITSRSSSQLEAFHMTQNSILKNSCNSDLAHAISAVHRGRHNLKNRRKVTKKRLGSKWVFDVYLLNEVAKLLRTCGVNDHELADWEVLQSANNNSGVARVNVTSAAFKAMFECAKEGSVQIYRSTHLSRAQRLALPTSAVSSPSEVRLAKHLIEDSKYYSKSMKKKVVALGVWAFICSDKHWKTKIAWEDLTIDFNKRVLNALAEKKRVTFGNESFDAADFDLKNVRDLKIFVTNYAAGFEFNRAARGTSRSARAVAREIADRQATKRMFDLEEEDAAIENKKNKRCCPECGNGVRIKCKETCAFAQFVKNTPGLSSVRRCRKLERWNRLSVEEKAKWRANNNSSFTD